MLGLNRRQRTLHRAVQDVLEFAHVPRPIVIHEGLQRPFGEAGPRFAEFLRQLGRKIMGEQQDVLAALSGGDSCPAAAGE
ncbi:MAG: hypothetical protein NT025_09065 [bacterium]|nr:hypothetical protein [bacterium]